MKIHIEIYMQILEWFAMQYTAAELHKELVIQIAPTYFVNVHYSSDWDIDISHYMDEECEINISWWWRVTMEDFDKFMSKGKKADEKRIKKLNKRITDKCEFIYQLCFSW